MSLIEHEVFGKYANGVPCPKFKNYSDVLAVSTHTQASVLILAFSTWISGGILLLLRAQNQILMKVSVRSTAYLNKDVNMPT